MHQKIKTTTWLVLKVVFVSVVPTTSETTGSGSAKPGGLSYSTLGAGCLSACTLHVRWVACAGRRAADAVLPAAGGGGHEHWGHPHPAGGLRAPAHHQNSSWLVLPGWGCDPPSISN